MQSLDGRVELTAERGEPETRFLEFPVRLGARGVEGGEKPLADFRLVRLVAVQFETEIPDADAVKPLFDDGERRHLFGDEEHPFALREGVCDHVRDGLRLARSRRSVQNETFALGRRSSSGELRFVRRNGQEHVPGLIVPVDVHLPNGHLLERKIQSVLNQGFDQSVL